MFRYLRTTYLDFIAVTLSFLCLVHCLLVPIIISILPFFASNVLSHEYFHGVALFVAVPISLLGLGMGYLTHKNKMLISLAFIGFTLMMLGLFFHDVETVLTVMGVSIISFTHVLNWRQHYLYHGHGTSHSHCRKCTDKSQP